MIASAMVFKTKTVFSGLKVNTVFCCAPSNSLVPFADFAVIKISAVTVYDTERLNEPWVEL